MSSLDQTGADQLDNLHRLPDLKKLQGQFSGLQFDWSMENEVYAVIDQRN